MPNHHFISYSFADPDAEAFTLRLADALQAGPPPIPVWLYKRESQAGIDWDVQIVEAIRSCITLLFVMTHDSVEDQSGCKQEWTRALKYKKPIIPLRLHADAELPYRLEPRQYIDFTGNYDTALAQLRKHLQWLASPAGALQALKYRLADAQRDLQREKDPQQRMRIQDDLAQLEKQITEQQRAVDDPEGTAKRVAESIAAGLEREREPQKPISDETRTKFINPPPMTAPSYFQDRHVETKLIADFLRDDSRRMLTLVGRGGTGKTALTCRLLKALEQGHLPDDLSSLAVDGIVYLSAVGSRRVRVPDLYADLLKLLPPETAQHLDSLYKNPQASTDAKMRALLAAFPQGRNIVLLDNFEDVVDTETLNLRDVELEEALTALLQAPSHAIKVIITTRIAPRGLALVQPARQMRLDLDEGLASPFAENILREMDVDGKVGLKTAPEDLLSAARARTRGYPRAIEALFAILSADRDTTLQEILQNVGAHGVGAYGGTPLPENVVRDLVGEAFDRLDLTAQQVMQALAIYGRPVTPTAVDYLLQPVLTGVNSAPVLSRLVNMHFVRKEAGRYYLHPVDRDYALSRVRHGEAGDREVLDDKTPFTQIALADRGANYFKETRLPRAKWKTLADLAPQLAEIDLRLEAEDYDSALGVLLKIDHNYLTMWGHYSMLIKIYEQIQGKLTDLKLKLSLANGLGGTYYNAGQYAKAIIKHEQALMLARDAKDKKREGVELGNLGNLYADIGQSVNAIAYFTQALRIACEVGDRHAEGAWVFGLATCYADLGQTTHAVSQYERALVLHNEIGDQVGKGFALSWYAETLIDLGRFEEAAQYGEESVKVASDIGSTIIFSYGYSRLALAHFFAGDLSAARMAAIKASKYEEPRNVCYALAILGVIAFQESDWLAAQQAFIDTVVKADELLSYTTQNYVALYSKGLALSGLAMCEDRYRIIEAVEAFKTARTITTSVGIVKRVLRLFDELAKADAAGILKEVRAAAAGE